MADDFVDGIMKMSQNSMRMSWSFDEVDKRRQGNDGAGRGLIITKRTS